MVCDGCNCYFSFWAILSNFEDFKLQSSNLLPSPLSYINIKNMKIMIKQYHCHLHLVSSSFTLYQICVAKRSPLLRKVVFFYCARINIFSLYIKSHSYHLQLSYHSYHSISILVMIFYMIT